MSAVASCAMLAAEAKPGKQALKNEHRELIVETKRAKVSISVNFEDAADHVGASRELKRWDYLFETLADSQTLHAVEVHEFDRSVLRKKQIDTLAILERHCPATASELKSWHVILKGSLPRQDILGRFSADSGMKLGRSLHIAKL
ncbi:MAG TPA: hypothetical protein VGE56_03685 [Rhodocyclaceae bacterium]